MPEWSQWNRLQTDFLERLGCEPGDIDLVVSTHLHYDHVGWNTRLIDGKWRPTFLNARYLIVRSEFDYWKSHPKAELADDHLGIKDSVEPVVEAGLADLVTSDYQIAPGVSLFPTPGHTPGHVGILIESNGEQAVITGDILHHPCQIAHPEWGTSGDPDPDMVLGTRRAFLERFCDGKTVVLGSHFSSPTGGLLEREGRGYKLSV